MKRIALAALFAVPFTAQAEPPCVPNFYGTVAPFKTRPNVVADWARTTHGRHVWWYCQTGEPRPRPVMIVCKHGVCDLGGFTNKLDTARIATDPVQALKDAWNAAIPAGGVFCFKLTADGKNLLLDAAGQPVPDPANTDADFAAACKEAVPDLLRDWLDAPPAPPPPPPPPAPPPPSSFVVAPTSICQLGDKDATGKCVTRQSYTWDGKVRGSVAQPERATIGAPCDPSKGPAPYFVFDANKPDRVVQCVKK